MNIFNFSRSGRLARTVFLKSFRFARHAARSTVFPTDLAGTKRQFVLIYGIRLFFLVGRRLWRDNCPREAAALSFQTILSTVPLVILIFATASWLSLDEYVASATAFLENYLMPDAAASAARRIKELASSFKPGTLGLLGGVSLLMVALTLIFSVEQAVNEIFRCPEGRPLWVRVPIGVFLIIAAPAAFGLSVYLASLFLFQVSTSMQVVLPIMFTVMLLFLAYWLLPHRKIRPHLAFAAAVVAGVALESLKWGFAYYVSYQSKTLTSVYGTLAIVPLFLMWVYTAWLFFLFGAQLNAALHEVRAHHALTGEQLPELQDRHGI